MTTPPLAALAVKVIEHPLARRMKGTKVGRVLRATPGADRAWRGLNHRYASRARSGASGVTPFVILGQARTGSNLLQTELCRRWPEVRCLGEEYGPDRRRQRPGETTGEVTARVFAATDEHPVVGCRVFYGHVTAAEFGDLLKTSGIKVVHLRRRNILRRYVSLQIALHNDVWARGRRRAAPPIDDRAVTIDVDDFIESSTVAAERRTDLERALADAGVAVLDVWYEELSARLDPELRRIASFLGLGEPVRESEPVLMRQNPEPLRLLVRNYAEVERRLARTSMREFLDAEDDGIRRRGQSPTCWPTEEQELLLRGALLPVGEAADPFVQWRNLTNPDDIDEGSRRLYPLVYRNLRRAGVETTFDIVMRHAYVQASARNQMLLRTLERVLGHLHGAEVPVLVLKGAALTVLHYRDRGARPMNDLDVLVPRELIGRTLEVLRADGWGYSWPEHERMIEPLRLRHGVTLQQGDDEVDVHWHTLAVCMNPGLDTDLWDASVELVVGGQRARALGPADQLLHAFAHGLRYNEFPPLRWVADAHVVITSSGSELDWDRLLRLSTRHGLAAYTSQALTFLDRLFPTIVPPPVLAAARALPISRRERRQFERAIRPSHWLPKLWDRYRQSEPDRSALGAAVGFAPVLRTAYDVDHLWQLPRRAVARMQGARRHDPIGTGDG